MSYNGKYPFGLHGYHRPSSNGKVKASDPLNVFGGTYDPNKASTEAAQQDEARKAALRAQIDKMYGIGGQVPVYGAPPQGVNLGSAFMAPTGYQDDPEVVAAKNQMQADDASVSDATRSYYSDQLSRSVAAAERNNRFNLARQGLSGGSQDIDSNKEIATDQALGATRIDTAARSASASLDAQRENERLGAQSLVNAGAGQQAVESAQRGLQSSLNTANNQQRTDLSSDLFTGFADNYAMNNANSANAALLARYQNSLGAFFPTKSTGGSVTPSG